jgi:2',3'-cyclic-nucleotide 2'-phosphodiesterase / 3'-nucleotidase
MRNFNRLLILFIVIFWFCGCQPKADVNITIIETTDLHGFFFSHNFIKNEPAKHSLSKIYTYIDSLRNRDSNPLILLDNGDLLQGQPVVYYYNVIDTTGINLGASVLNFMKYDAAAPGNHDIECGHQVFDKVNRQLQCPWLAANIINVKTHGPYFKPYTIINRNGIRIAVLGLITPGVPDWVPEKLWEGMQFDDMVETAKKWVAIIRENEKPDLVIALCHSGVDPNYNGQNEDTYKNENASRLIAQNVPGIDIVFAGHDHNPLSTQLVNIAGDTALLLNGGCHANGIARVDLKFVYDKKKKRYVAGNKQGQYVKIDSQKENKSFDDYFANKVNAAMEFVSKPVCGLSQNISTDIAYFGSNPFVDMIHQLQLDASGAKVSFASPLSFKAELIKGEITVGSLFELYRYENLLYVLNLKGEEIDRYLEFTAGLWFNQMKSTNDHLLNLTVDKDGKYRLSNQYYNLCSAAGIEYLVDVSKPVGQRVRILGFSDGTPFNSNETYPVAMNSYRGSGGGGHLKAAGLSEQEIKERLIWTSDKDIRLLLMQWFEKQGNISPKALKNWRIIPEDFYEKGKLRDYKLLFNNNDGN